MKLKTIFFLQLLTIYLLIFNSETKAQNEYRYPLDDAIKYTSDKIPIRSKIINAYISDQNCDITELKANQFLTNIQETISSAEYIRNDKANFNSSQNSYQNKSLGAPLIDALATVIAKRFKEELTLAFLENFREKLKTDSSLAKLFPNAKNVLLNDDPFNYKIWLTSFRGALDEDLRELPENLPFLLKDIKAIDGLQDNQKNILDALITAYIPALEFVKNPQKSYTLILSFLNSIKGKSYISEDFSASITFSYVLIYEMGNSAYNDWADTKVLKKLVDNPETIRNFIGFCIEKHKKTFKSASIKFNNDGSNLYDVFHNDAFESKVVKYTRYFSKASYEINSISEITRALKGKKSKLLFDDYQPLISKSVEMISLFTGDDFLKIIDSQTSKSNAANELIENTRLSIGYAAKINSNINSKEYSKIIANTLSFITKYVDQEDLDKSISLKEFIKYADLAINLSSATSSEELVSVIESAALPSQSYRLKRNSYFSISLNSYAGVFVANEFLTNKDVKNETSIITGFKAPVGIGFNWAAGISDSPTRYSKHPTETIIENKKIKKQKNYFKGHSLSIFLSVIDLGAITSFRLTNDEAPINDIQWQNVLAPGAYFIWGIGNSPLALSIGGQYGPELRKVEAADGVTNSTIESRAFRVGLGLTVDIPLLHFYSKSERVKFK